MEKLHYYRQNFKKEFLAENSKTLHNLFKIASKFYNRCLYIQQENFKNGGKYITYPEMREILKVDINFLLLGEKTAVSIIRNLDINYKNFFTNNTKTKNLDAPKFRNKDNFFISFFSIYMTNNNTINIFLTKDFKEKFNISNNLIIKVTKNFYKKNKKITQLRLSLKYCVYHYSEDVETFEKDKKNILGIDLGVDNLISVFSTHEKAKNFVIKGKYLKFINYKYLSHEKLTKEKRKNIIENYFDKCVKLLFLYCKKYKISEIICGFFKDIKKKHKNRNFFYIPFLILRRKLKDMCKKYDINFTLTEESYTSKSCFLIAEELKKHKIFAGYRKKRGLYKLKMLKIEYNCDINGAANIICKKFFIAKDAKIRRKVLENPVIFSFQNKKGGVK